jgi:hypothetical protein
MSDWEIPESYSAQEILAPMQRSVMELILRSHRGDKSLMILSLVLLEEVLWLLGLVDDPEQKENFDFDEELEKVANQANRIPLLWAMCLAEDSERFNATFTRWRLFEVSFVDDWMTSGRFSVSTELEAQAVIEQISLLIKHG